MVFVFSFLFELLYFEMLAFLYLTRSLLYIHSLYYSRSMMNRYTSFLDAGALHEAAQPHGLNVDVYPQNTMPSSFGDRA